VSLIVELQLAQTGTVEVPVAEKFQQWAGLAYDGRYEQAELAVRVTDEAEIAALNLQYRHKNGPTNVLSFPVDESDESGVYYLGDIVICADVVASEALQQSKTLESHWAHMVLHGTLHLLGYDHESDEDADEMETFEIELMQKLGYENPYLCEKS